MSYHLNKTIALLTLLACAGCIAGGTPSSTPVPPTATLPVAPPSSTPVPTIPPSPTSLTPLPPSPTVPPTVAPVSSPPPGWAFATLDDFWNGAAGWLLEKYDVGLPIGESDTIYLGNNEFWSYLHASYASAGVLDQCGAPVSEETNPGFVTPGCVTLWKSYDGGLTFTLEEPVCLFPCETCPCDPYRDQVNQQQYPRVFFDTDQAYMVYEWGAGTYLRTSFDGLEWSLPAHVPGSGAWYAEQDSCTAAESIGEHPNIFADLELDCLIGAPPGVYVEGNQLYVFLGLGRAPGHMGCYVGNKYAGATGLSKCTANPLFGAELGYGPVDLLGPAANPYFEYRTISSADVVRVGDHYYMAYEGVRGPSDPYVRDNQFALGFARSTGPTIDGPWERFPGNPVIMDMQDNWGVGHADIVVIGPATYLYTATSTTTRGRYVLLRRE